MSRRKWVRTVLWSLGSLLITQCNTSGGKSAASLTSQESPGSGLDVNDVSILFPLPDKIEDIRKMLPITFASDGGRSPMTPGLFADILAHHNYEITVDGKKTKLSSGSAFDGKGRITRNSEPGRVFGPYNDPNDWKIVAMRFDPCAPSPTENLRGKPAGKLPSAISGDRCLGQIRLTAQPVLDKSRESVAGKFAGDVLVSDYALHLLFEISQADVRGLYRDLVKFRDDCRNVTASMPLGLHPCLQIEKNRGMYGDDKFNNVYSIIKRYAKKYVSIAMMSTLGGDDPWAFMFGTVKDDKFVHLPIDAVHQDDPAKIKRGNQGNMLEPFANGFFQQISFLSVAVESTTNIKAIRELRPGDRVAPFAIAEKVNEALTKETDLRSMPGDPDSVRALNIKLNRMENPLVTDTFSTDCASCHFAAPLWSRIGARWEPYLFEKKYRGMGYSLFTEPNFFDDSHDPHNVRRKAPFAFDVGERYANFVDQNTAVDGGSGRPKRFIHFGHHGVRPQVSQRVANESAMVAKLANDIFNSGLAPEMTCPKTPLLECIDSSEMILEKMSSSFMLSHCLQKICPNRAQELAPLFANDRSHRYRALKDIPLFFMNNPSKAKIVLRKGSIVSGRLEPRLGKYDLITPDVLEVEIEDGTKIYAPGHSFFGFAITSLDGNFEEIN